MSAVPTENRAAGTVAPVEVTQSSIVIRNSLCPDFPDCMGMNAKGTYTGAKPFHDPEYHKAQGLFEDQGIQGHYIAPEEAARIEREKAAATRPGLLGRVPATVLGQIKKGTGR